ncbi:MAG: hypothetical protein DRG83_02560 [Deltaproteobacteria bacterium]|nr:MAG: hypothetical protein DRG83_02560 [Deltaproteobacteria bacterium]
MKKSRLVTVVAAVLCFLLLTALSTMAQQSVEVINYQGKLTNSDGSPLEDGTYSAMFEIFDTPSPAQGQNPLWNSARDLRITVVQGVFSVELGVQNPFPKGLFQEHDDLYLRITIEGERMFPLQHLTAVPYSFRAIRADYALSAHSMDNGMIPGDLFVDGNLGVNISSPGAGLHVVQPLDEDAFRVDDQDNDTTPFVIDDKGSVGIGTETPDAKLHVIMPSGRSGIPPIFSTTKGLVIRDGAFNTANQLEIQDKNGKPRFVVDTSGKVGIGTGTPESLFHLKSERAVEIILEADTDNDAGEEPARMLFRQDAGTVSARVGYRDDENAFEIMQEFDDSLILGTNDLSRMTITANGYVGIGTSNPETKLVIEGNGTSWAQGFICLKNFGDAGIRFYRGTTDDALKYHIYNDSPSNILRIAPQSNLELGGITVTQSGNVGIGTTIPTKALTVRGNLLIQSQSNGADIVELGEGLDYAEGFNVSDQKKLEAGTVLIIDPDNAGHLTQSFQPYDRKVAGIVAGAKGLGSGVRLAPGQFDHDVALAGRVYCKVDATKEGIQPGDLLTTSATPGYAMKVMDYSRAQGAVLGKAMESLEKGKKGLILVLVTLQ